MQDQALTGNLDEENEDNKNPRRRKALELTWDTKMLVLRMCAERKNPTQIIAHFHKQDLVINPGQITRLVNNPKHAGIIENFYKDYLARIKEVPIANKRIRLEMLEKNRMMLEKFMDTLCVDDPSARREIVNMIRRMNETMATARDEIEGKPGIVQQFNLSQHSNYSDEEIEKKRQVLLARIEGRPAPRDLGVRGADTGEEAKDSFQSP